MPINLRLFTIQKMNQFFENKKEAQEKAQGRSKLQSQPARGPDIKPSYTTKARK